MSDSPKPDTAAMPLGQSEVGGLVRVAVMRAADAFPSQGAIDRQWRELGYLAPPDRERAITEHERLVEVLESLGAEARFVEPADGLGLDAIYVRDAAVVCDRGAVLCNMGKAERSAEPAVLAAALRSWGVPVLGAVSGEGRLEGGDLVWLDDRTLAVGEGYRTNAEGIRQLGIFFESCFDELITVPLPHWQGPGDVFHLMSIVSPIDRDLLLVYSPLLPVPFRRSLLDRGFRLVDVPDDEFASMGANVLAVGGGRCVALAGNPRTRLRLERAGAEVHVISGDEICAKGLGGPTCLTRPIRRAAP